MATITQGIEYVHGVMVQVMIQLIQHHSIIVFFSRFGLRANAVVFFEEVATKAAKPGHVVSSQDIHGACNKSHIFMSPSSYSECA